MAARKTGPKPRPMAERFWPKVDKSGGPDACWPWTAARTKQGYGKIGRGARQPGWAFASRVALELTNGPIPPGLFACHHCDNPPCCNPAHLFLGTCGENLRDMAAKRRSLWQRRPELAHAARGKSVAARKAKALARLPVPCVQCSRPVMVRRKGRCGACSAFFERNGFERPPQGAGQPRGERNRNAKLTWRLVGQMRSDRLATGMTYAALGKKYGVAKSQAHFICIGRFWKAAP